jgi:hypothetical protein
LPHGILHVFILYENEFKNPQLFQQTISLFPEQSALGNKSEIGHETGCVADIGKIILKMI